MHLTTALVVALFAASCGSDDVCGPGEAPADGLTVTGDLETAGGLTYGDATTSPNNDCSVDEAPTSLTIDIAQVDPITAARRALILCVPRPDNLDETLSLTDDSVTTGVQLIDIFADDGDCLISLDRTGAISGTATFTGACSDGTDPLGYALELSAQIPVTKSCPGGDTNVTITVAGELAVTAL